MSLAKRRFLRSGPGTVSLSDQKGEPLDPSSDLLILTIELEDLLNTIFRVVSAGTQDLLVSQIIHVLRPTSTNERAISIGVSPRTLYRRERLLREYITSWYRKQEE